MAYCGWAFTLDTYSVNRGLRIRIISGTFLHMKEVDQNQSPAPTDPFSATLGDLIREAREKKGMSKARLSKLTGISPNSLVKYEKAGHEGGMEPSLKNMAKISAVLDLDPRSVFERTCRDNNIYESEKSIDGHRVLISFHSRWRERDAEYHLRTHYRNPKIRKIVDALASLDHEFAGVDLEAQYYLHLLEKERGTDESNDTNENGPS